MSSEQELDLKPHAVIVANDITRFAEFAAFLEKNGFPCQNVQALNEVKSRPGSVYFLSFNLMSEPAVNAAKKIEQTPGHVCIVFAEEAGVQTAAKLSSAKMSQTLQHPYTEKNFLMALQTIVKKRKAQFEKDLRKRQHEDRMKARMVNSIPEKDHGVIIQEAPENLTDSTVRVFKTDAAEMYSEIQSGAHAKSFFIIQEGPKTVGGSEREAMEKVTIKRLKMAPEHTTVKRKFDASEEVQSSPEELDEAAQSTKSVIKLAVVPEKDENSPKAANERTPKSPPAYERPMSHFWAVLGVCLVGSAICLYCVYQILTL